MSGLDLYQTIIGSIGGIIGIIVAIYRLLEWHRSHNPMQMDFTFDDIHKLKGEIKWNHNLKISTGERVEVVMRLRVKRFTRFSEITIKPMVRYFKIHWLGLWQWRNVDADCPLAVFNALDQTRQSQIRHIFFSCSRDDRCGIQGNYAGVRENGKEEFTIASDSHINIELWLKATVPWKGYIEFSNTPLEGNKHFVRRRVVIEEQKL